MAEETDISAACLEFLLRTELHDMRACQARRARSGFAIPLYASERTACTENADRVASDLLKVLKQGGWDRAKSDFLKRVRSFQEGLTLESLVALSRTSEFEGIRALGRELEIEGGKQKA